jgi:quercetin dioxygenase-like cupin family protein
MVYATCWESLPEVEVLQNNFRRAVSGVEVGINHVRWVHPSGTPAHVHDDAEKAVLVLEGTMEWSIGGQPVVLEPGVVAIVPRGTQHAGRTTGDDVRFLEVFSPARIQNLVGFLGQGLLPAGSSSAVEQSADSLGGSF